MRGLCRKGVVEWRRRKVGLLPVVLFLYIFFKSAVPCGRESQYSLTHFPYHLRPRTPTPRIITTTQRLPTCDMHILIRNAITTPISTQDVIIPGLGHNPPSHILEPDILNSYSISSDARGSTVQVVLLDIDTILLDIGERDIGEGHVDDAACSVEVGLDAQTVGGVCYNGIGESVELVQYSCSYSQIS